METVMPVLSKFYGIVIRMLFSRMLPGQFHAFYQDAELVVWVAPVRIINGEAPRRMRAMVLEWGRQHEQELMQAWSRCRAALPPRPIQPLD
jgi:hypothetical protein